MASNQYKKKVKPGKIELDDAEPMLIVNIETQLIDLSKPKQTSIVDRKCSQKKYVRRSMSSLHEINRFGSQSTSAQDPIEGIHAVVEPGRGCEGGREQMQIHPPEQGSYVALPLLTEALLTATASRARTCKLCFSFSKTAWCRRLLLCQWPWRTHESVQLHHLHHRHAISPRPRRKTRG